MSGLQTIINSSSGMTVNRRKVTGMQITRNEIPRVSTTPTKNPWKFELDMPTSFRYNDARALMESIDTLDATGYQDITFSNNACLNWIYRYQGTLPLTQLNALTVSTFTGNQLVLTGLPGINANRVMFEPNDLIQIAGYPYPFTSTTQVTRGVLGTVTITTHRPNILSNPSNLSPPPWEGLNILVGNNCIFRLFCPNMPVYKLIVGGSQYSAGGTLVGNALIEWSDSFQLYEYVGTS
tara:strand:- start:3583 stop:4293 length:711 start_codon:yes stop_codon:yes gene_type:complete